MFFGKILGGLLGYLAFGLPGFIVGVMLGSFFDKGFTVSTIYMSQDLSKTQEIFFRSTFEVMGAIAKADGRVSEAEVQAVRKVMAHLNLNETQKLQAIAYFSRGKSQDYNLEAAIALFRQYCGRDANLVRLFIEIQLEGAFADGGLHEAEVHVLKFICERLGVSHSFIDELTGRSRAEHNFYRHQAGARQASPKNELKDAYGVLGLSTSATPGEVKKAYRRLMSQHHPDKLAARGLPEAMRKIATEKTQQIQKAYEFIVRARPA